MTTPRKNKPGKSLVMPRNQVMTVGRVLYVAYFEGGDIVLRAVYSNDAPAELRLSGKRLAQLLRLEAP